MTTYGVTLTGFVTKLLADIKSEIESAMRAVFGAAVDLSSEGPLGQIVGIMAEREASLWGVAEDIYNSAYPDTAEGAPLDNAVGYTGIKRLAATYSKITGAFFFGDNGTVIPAGTQAQVAGNAAALFAVDANVTIAAPVIDVQTITFSVTPTGGAYKITRADTAEESGSLAFGANAAAVQAALRLMATAVPGKAPVGLTLVTVTGSAAAGFVVTLTGTHGPQAALTVSSSTLTGSGTVTPTTTHTTPGTCTTGNLTATATGPTAAPAGGLTVIINPISGWASVVNPAAAALGKATETDAAIKLRRVQSLQAPGASTVPTIRAKLLAVANVTAVTVFENTTLATDADSRPAKSFEAVVQGGADQDVINVIWEEKPAGIQAYGTTTGSAVDSQGNSQSVSFSRPTLVPIYVAVTLTKNASYPSGGDATVAALILAYGNALALGAPVVVVPGIVAAIAGVPGIIGAVIYIGLAPSPVSATNLVMTSKQLASFDAARITVA